MVIKSCHPNPRNKIVSLRLDRLVTRHRALGVLKSGSGEACSQAIQRPAGWLEKTGIA